MGSVEQGIYVKNLRSRLIYYYVPAFQDILSKFLIFPTSFSKCKGWVNVLFISSRFSPVNSKNCPIVILLKRLKYSTYYAANGVIGVKWGQTGLKRGQMGSNRVKRG